MVVPAYRSAGGPDYAWRTIGERKLRVKLYFICRCLLLEDVLRELISETNAILNVFAVAAKGKSGGWQFLNFRTPRSYVQKFERVEGACFDDMLGKHLDLAAIAVHAERNPALPLNLHRIIHVNRLTVEKHLVPKDLRQRLCIVNADILNEFLTQLRTEDVPVSVDDASGCLGLSHWDLLEIVHELALEECVSKMFCHLFRFAQDRKSGKEIGDSLVARACRLLRHATGPILQ
jgi:hypothetical protein